MMYGIKTRITDDISLNLISEFKNEVFKQKKFKIDIVKNMASKFKLIENN